MISRDEAIKIIADYEINGCGYCHQGGEEVEEAFAMAIEALKAQEPRVMTLEEALAADYVYLEIRLHPNLPCECCILAVESDGDILALKRGFGGYLDREEYGETWRCWTARPDKATREATPWQ